MFTGKAVQPSWTPEGDVPGTMYAATENGWMVESTFYDWLTKMFTPHVNKVRQDRAMNHDTKAVLFVDGHASHISVRIVEHAIENNIHIVKFPSHLTDKLQPLDKCVFGPLKDAWEDLLVVHGRTKMGKGPCHLQKGEFSILIKQVWTDIKSANIVKWFSTTGIFPIDKSKIPESWFCADQLRRYKRYTLQKMAAPPPMILTQPRLSVRSDAVTDGDFSDMPMDLSMKRNTPPEPVDEPRTVKDIVQVFRDNIRMQLEATPSTSSGPKTRLAHHTYGRSWKKLKEAEHKKALKRPNVGGKRGRPKKTKTDAKQ